MIILSAENFEEFKNEYFKLIGEKGFNSLEEKYNEYKEKSKKNVDFYYGEVFDEKIDSKMVYKCF